MYTENKSWIVERGDDVIGKKVHAGDASLTDWEQLVFCLWVTDYMMCNAGDFANADVMYPTFQTDTAQLAERLGLPKTFEAFSLSQDALQQEYFARFEAICDEIKSAELTPGSPPSQARGRKSKRRGHPDRY